MSENTQLALWEFPDIEQVVESQVTDYIPFAQEKQEQTDNTMDMITLENERREAEHQAALAELKRCQAEMENLNAQLNQAKQLYDDKLLSLTRIIDTVNQAVHKIDEDYISFIHKVIKKIAHKLIYKELRSKPETFKKMFEGLKQELIPEESMMTIHVCPQDHALLNSEDESFTKSLRLDKQLQPGDVIIKSNFSEVRALLDERIDKVLQVEHG